MWNENTKKFIAAIAAVAVILLVGWFLLREPGPAQDNYHDVSAGFQRTSDELERVQGNLDDGQGTADEIGRGIEDSERTAEGIERANHNAEGAVSYAEGTNRDAESAVDRGVKLIEQCESILDRYTK